MRKLASLSLIAALSLSIVACGSSGSDGSKESDDTTTTVATDTTGTDAEDPVDVSDVTEADYVAALVVNMTSGQVAEGDLVLEQAQAECVAPRWVEIFTVDALHEASISVSVMSTPNFDASELGLDADQGTAMADTFGECDVDIVGLFAESLGQSLSPELQTCVAENIDRDLSFALISKSFSSEPSDAEFEAVTTALREDCPGLPS